MSVRANITPEVLLWARDTAGYSVDEVATKLKRKSVTSATIEAWETGKKKPTYAQLEKLAEYYNRPIAVFYFPEPPQEEDIGEKFRSLPRDYSLSPVMRYLVRKASVKQLDLYELHGDAVPEHMQIIRDKITGSDLNDAKAVARQVRDIIGISLEKQLRWQDADDAMKQWRSALENIGIWVFKDAFKDNRYSGFCLDDTHFPVIYINNSMAKERQIFTLFHELAHLISEKSGVDFRQNVENELFDRYRAGEVFCNAFAGALLVPDDGLGISRQPDDTEIIHYAKKYHVSRQVILRKYLDRNLITNNFYDEKILAWEDDWKNKGRVHEGSGENKTGGGNYYATQKSYLGNKYMRLVFSQYYSQRINQYQLADYLGVKIPSLATLEGVMHQGSED